MLLDWQIIIFELSIPCSVWTRKIYLTFKTHDFVLFILIIMERGLTIRSGVNRLGWEEADFPIVCNPCLGDNPYIKMVLQNPINLA